MGDLWKNQIEFLDALRPDQERDAPRPGSRSLPLNPAVGALDAFKRRAAALGLTDALVWTGRLAKDDMLSFYADIDLAVSTHRNEGFGIWVLEALAVGTPVVSVNEGGIRDSLEGCPAGVLVDGGPEHMADAIIRVLNDPALKKDVGCRTRLGLRALQQGTNGG